MLYYSGFSTQGNSISTVITVVSVFCVKTRLQLSYFFDESAFGCG